MDPQVIKQLDHIIKINQRVAQSVGRAYLSYLHTIFNELISVYNIYSQCISENLETNDSRIKPMKALRRDILRLIQTYIEKEEDFAMFNQHMLPSLQNMMSDFVNSNPNARDPETLMLFATIIKKDFDFFNASSLQVVLDSLCQSTLAMIGSDLTSNPEFRIGFFKLIHNIIIYCTQGLLNLEQ